MEKEKGGSGLRYSFDVNRAAAPLTTRRHSELLWATGSQILDARLLAGLASFKAVVLEGLEVVFIVIAVGARRGLLGPASLGALAACLVVIVVGLVVHRPLARVPENTLKFGVGVMLSSFGVFWIGEALGVPWPGQDFAILAFAAIFLIAALLSVILARRVQSEHLT